MYSDHLVPLGRESLEKSAYPGGRFTTHKLNRIYGYPATINVRTLVTSYTGSPTTTSYRHRPLGTLPATIQEDSVPAVGTRLGSPPAFYLETDLFSDVDDVGGLAIACALAARGDIALVGIGINTPSRWGAPAARVITDAYGIHPPIATYYPQDNSVFEKDFANALATTFPAIDPAEKFVGGPEGLWAALKTADNGSLGIISTGFFPNLVSLLDMERDTVKGADLVRDKVSSTVVMGGHYPVGREFNFMVDPSNTRRFLDDWPVPSLFVGWETAHDIITGKNLDGTLGPSHPVSLAYRLYSERGMGRSSWDPLTVAIATKTLKASIITSGTGRVSVDETGANDWEPGTDPYRHRYVTAVGSGELTAQNLNDHMHL